MAERPSCIKCAHYFVTHEPANPFGCRIMGFKSAQNPAALVFASSGIECQLFKSKNPSNQNTSGSGHSSGGIVA